MCTGENCPLKETCYRYTAFPNQWGQSYYVNVPYNEEKKECEEYRENYENNKHEK